MLRGRRISEHWGGRSFGDFTAVIVAAAILLVVTTGRAEAVKYRIQGQGGYNAVLSGFNSEILKLNNGVGVSLADAITGDGVAAGAAIYVDEWIGQNWTIGLEYLYSTAEANTSLAVTGVGGAALNTKLDAELHTFYINSAYRVNDPNFKWHPFIGVGLGGGYTDIEVSVSAAGAGAFVSGSGKVDTPYIGAQAFVGFDYDLTERIYLGTNAKFFYIDGRIVDQDIQIGVFSILGTLGYKF